VPISPVVSVKSSASVKEVAKLLFERRVSAFLWSTIRARVVGVVSEGNLLRRAESDTERRRSWWLLGLTGEDALA
jgi:CBS domain-containing protein